VTAKRKEPSTVPKRPVGRPRSGLNTMIAIRWEPWVLAGIDKYGKQHLLARPQALRHIVVRHLAKQGLIDPKVMYRRERM